MRAPELNPFPTKISKALKVFLVYNLVNPGKQPTLYFSRRLIGFHHFHLESDEYKNPYNPVNPVN
jgi:hypothetical protein